MRVPRYSHTFIYSPGYTHGERALVLRSYPEVADDRYISGQCATHFRQILTKFPPQVSSRSTAAAWACHVHNEVNKSLKKDIFDCSKIGDFYDCGCADDKSSKSEGGTGTAASSGSAKPKLEDSKTMKLIEIGRKSDGDGRMPLKLEKEG